MWEKTLTEHIKGSWSCLRWLLKWLFLLFDLLLCNFKAKIWRKSSGLLQMTDDWHGLSENQKLCVKKETGTIIKSECLVSGDRKKYGFGNGGGQFKRRHMVYQTNRCCQMSKELAPYSVEILDWFEVWCGYDLWELSKWKS